MKCETENIFQLSKNLYDQINEFYQVNYIGQQQKLDLFVEQNIEPLYPSKPVDDLDDLKGSDIVTKHHNSRIHNQKTRRLSFEEMTDFQINSPTQTEFSDKSQVIYTNVIRRYKMKELCLELGTGNFFCWKSSPPSQVYEQMGLSTCLYLKFVKHFISALLMIMPLTIFMLILFYSTAMDSGIVPTTNYQKFIFSFSIGTLSLQETRCVYSQVPQTNQPFKVKLVCPLGYVSILGPIYAAGKFQSMENCRKDIDNYIDQNQKYIRTQDYSYSTTCNENSQQCLYELILLKKNINFKKISIAYECKRGQTHIGGIQIKTNTIIYLLVVFDLFSVIILSLFLWSQISAEQKEQKYFKEKQLQLNSFSVEVGSFSKSNFEYQLNQFLDFMEQKTQHLTTSYKICRNKIVQIRIPEEQIFIKHQQIREKSYKDLYYFIGKYFFEKQFNPNRYLSEQDFKNNMLKNTQSFDQYLKSLSKLINQYKINQLLPGNNFNQCFNVYIVFQKPKYKRFLYEKSNLGSINIKGKTYKLRQLPPPDLIIWQNLQKNKLPRIAISIAVTFLTIVGSYFLLALILSLRNKAKSNFNFDVDCSTLYQNQNLNIFNFDLNFKDDTATYLHCFCRNNSFLSINTDPLCKNWSQQYFGFLMIPVFFSVAAVLLNIILSFIYKKLSHFQGYHKITSQLYSYIIKKSLLLVLLLGVIIITLSFTQNAQSDIFYFLYEGTYKDISGDWYQQVGVIIVITLTFNMITPPIEVLLYFIKKLVLKVQLILFTKSPNYKKLKKSYLQLYSTDIFPIEERYAQLLAVSTICLSFNCVYPAMIVIFLIELILFAMIDKILIIKAYHKPVNFESKLHKKVVYSFFIIILLHLVVTAFLITEKYILTLGHFTNSLSVIQQQRSRIIAIFGTGYIVPYVIAIFLIAICLSIVCISHIFFSTKPTQTLKIAKDGIPFEEHNFYNLLNSFQLNKTFNLKQRQWQRNKLMQKLYLNKKTIKTENQQLNSGQELDSASRLLYGPSFYQLPIQSSQMLQVSVNQKEQQYSSSRNQGFSNEQKQTLELKRINSSNKKEQNVEKTQDKNKILRKIIKYSLRKLLSKKQKNQQDRLRLTRLVGMTTYERYKDWVFLEQNTKFDYKISSIQKIKWL